ncbi:hypothetical protein ACFQ4Q_18135 [Lysobacter gummosus]|uniref:hypothetical protein n=1 Tax=Lysobacter gummosus TaxID=262324 RepID=UPI00363F117A
MPTTMAMFSTATVIDNRLANAIDRLRLSQARHATDAPTIAHLLQRISTRHSHPRDRTRVHNAEDAGANHATVDAADRQRKRATATRNISHLCDTAHPKMR